jgi:hypothetical protein
MAKMIFQGYFGSSWGGGKEGREKRGERQRDSEGEERERAFRL